MILMRARQTDCLYSLEKEFYQIITYIRVTMLDDDKVCFASISCSKFQNVVQSRDPEIIYENRR